MARLLHIPPAGCCDALGMVRLAQATSRRPSAHKHQEYVSRSRSLLPGSFSV